MVNYEHEMVSRDEVVCFPESGCEFFTRDADVGDVQSVLCEYGAGEDETPVAIRRDGYFIIAALGEETFAALDDGITEASTE